MKVLLFIDNIFRCRLIGGQINSDTSDNGTLCVQRVKSRIQVALLIDSMLVLLSSFRYIPIKRDNAAGT